VTQVPANAATVKPENTPAAQFAGKNRALAGSKKRTAPAKNGKTFAHALENVRNAKLIAGKNGKRVKLPKPGKKAPATVLNRQIIRKQAASKKRHSAHSRSKSSGKSASDSALLTVQSAGLLKRASDEKQASVEKTETTPISVREKPIARSNSKTGKGKTTSSTLISKDQHIGSGNLSSQARRVEVVDARDMPSGSKAEPPRKGETKQTRLEVATKTNQSTNSIKGENKFATVETEIDMTNRFEKPANNRSAAADLSRKLDGQAGNEIVRQVKVVLSRANAGEVRINLRPDNLGRVRVQIHLEENRLTGRIFVESAAAREAFRSSLDGLHTRLVESGFGAADLELAWDEGRGNLAWNGESTSPHRKDTRSAAKEFENMASIAHWEALSDALVNMVV